MCLFGRSKPDSDPIDISAPIADIAVSSDVAELPSHIQWSASQRSNPAKAPPTVSENLAKAPQNVSETPARASQNVSEKPRLETSVKPASAETPAQTPAPPYQRSYSIHTTQNTARPPPRAYRTKNNSIAKDSRAMSFPVVTPPSARQPTLPMISTPITPEPAMTSQTRNLPNRPSLAQIRPSANDSASLAQIYPLAPSAAVVKATTAARNGSIARATNATLAPKSRRPSHFDNYWQNGSWQASFTQLSPGCVSPTGQGFPSQMSQQPQSNASYTSQNVMYPQPAMQKTLAYHPAGPRPSYSEGTGPSVAMAGMPSNPFDEEGSSDPFSVAAESSDPYNEAPIAWNPAFAALPMPQPVVRPSFSWDAPSKSAQRAYQSFSQPPQQRAYQSFSQAVEQRPYQSFSQPTQQRAYQSFSHSGSSSTIDPYQPATMHRPLASFSMPVPSQTQDQTLHPSLPAEPNWRPTAPEQNWRPTAPEPNWRPTALEQKQSAAQPEQKRRPSRWKDAASVKQALLKNKGLDGTGRVRTEYELVGEDEENAWEMPDEYYSRASRKTARRKNSSWTDNY